MNSPLLRRRPLAPAALASLALAALGLWYVLAAAFLPVSQDEAYYLAWGHELDWGYFDHPPGVAVLTALAHWAPWLHGRLATVAITLLLFSVQLRFFVLCGLRGQRFLLATVLALGNLGALLAGFLTTPDAALLFCWALALHEGAHALYRDPRRWLTTGLAVGCGLLSKYTMLVIGPVYLLAALLHKRQALRSPWPYAGALLAFLIYLPNLWWNAEHNWVTWRFQLRHGLSLARAQDLVPAGLPRAEPAPVGSPEQALAAALSQHELLAAEGKRPSAPSLPSWWQIRWQELTAPLSAWLRPVQQLTDFAAGQIAFWGSLAIPLLLALWQARRRWQWAGIKRNIVSEPDSLLMAATLLPLLVFALLSLQGKVEANWAVMYLLAAAPWFARHLALSLRSLLSASVCNALLMLAFLGHARAPFLPIRASQDRLLKETHGYQALSRELSQDSGLLFADSYQLVSLLHYYLPHQGVQQWPGITRPSEWLRRPSMQRLNLSAVAQAGGFRLVTTDARPPRIPGFAASALRRFDDCRQGYLQSLAHDGSASPVRPCTSLHRWYVVSYLTATSPAS